MRTEVDHPLFELAAQRSTQRSSSVFAQLQRALRRQAECGALAWEIGPACEAPEPAGFRLLVASGCHLRRRAYALAHRVYQACGYVAPEPKGWIVSPFDRQPETLTLLAEDTQGRDAATISLVFDGPAGLPCDALFGAELAPLRAQGRRLVEVTRNATDKAHAHSKPLLVHLFQFISVFARRLKDGTDFIIEVNPRHVAFFQRLLLFEILGSQRVCPRVNGAPAVLLRLDLAAQAEEIRQVGGSRGNARGLHGKTLYAHFQALADEHLMAAFLASQHRPMTAEEARYFGLDRDACAGGYS